MKGNPTMKNRKIATVFAPIFSVLGCFALSPMAQAVIPPPDGGYPGGNTAEGQAALLSLTTGTHNTAVGWFSLRSNATGNFNTALGAGTLALNNGDSNTATGVGALILNTSGTQNTANGTAAMVHNSTGFNNSALGAFALNSNVGGPTFGDGSFNNAIGANALFSNVDGFSNNALGASALFENIHAAANTAVGDLALAFNDVTGNNVAWHNTAVGALALFNNADGDSNTAVGYAALANNNGPAGSRNTAVGFEALSSLSASGNGFSNTAVGSSALSSNVSGSNNVAIGDRALSVNQNGGYNTVVGFEAGQNVEGGDNIYIGESAGLGITTESSTTRIGNPGFVDHCYIAGIVGNGPFGGDVSIDLATGQLGVGVSSQRFKKDIDPMDRASEAIFSLKPVTFHYKNDATNTPRFGLIAEEVAKVNPALIAVDKEGKPYSVRYEAVNAMLLNEFLKAHQKVEELQATVARQQKGMEVLTAQLKEQAAQIQKVSSQLQISEPASKLAVSNR
jgi:hypothetical protein